MSIPLDPSCMGKAMEIQTCFLEALQNRSDLSLAKVQAAHRSAMEDFQLATAHIPKDLKKGAVQFLTDCEEELEAVFEQFNSDSDPLQQALGSESKIWLRAVQRCVPRPLENESDETILKHIRRELEEDFSQLYRLVPEVMKDIAKEIEEDLIRQLVAELQGIDQDKADRTPNGRLNQLLEADVRNLMNQALN